MSNLAKADIKPITYNRAPNGTITTEFSDGTILTADGKFFGLRADAGQVSAFRPAIYEKPQGFIGRVQRAYTSFLGKPEPRRTTEMGASSAASPVTFYLTLWAQLFGRRTRIEDTRALYLSDPRVFQSTNMFVDIALKGGPKIAVNPKDRNGKKAQKIASEVEKIYNATLCQEWGKGLIVEGDLFIQHVIARDSNSPSGMKLTKAVAMPGVGMQRLVNDADQFIDEDRAFEQIDSMTFEHVATFASAFMTHTRWSKINGDQYGTSELCTARRLIRAIELCEQALTVSRMVRAPLRRLHNVGTETNTSSQQELDNYKAQNGFFTGKNEAYNPQSVLIDYYANGNVKIDTLLGDPNQANVDDLRYMADVLFCALPTPGPFFGFGLRDTKRDVLEDMKRLWIIKHGKLQEALNESVKHGFELALTLAHINPADVEYTVQWSGGTLDTVAEIIAYIAEAKAAKLISQRTAVTKVAQILGTTDIEGELAEIKKDSESEQKDQLAGTLAPIEAKAKFETPGLKNGALKKAPESKASKN
jgi:hypothetical protein